MGGKKEIYRDVRFIHEAIRFIGGVRKKGIQLKLLPRAPEKYRITRVHVPAFVTTDCMALQGLITA